MKLNNYARMHTNVDGGGDRDENGDGTGTRTKRGGERKRESNIIHQIMIEAQ